MKWLEKLPKTLDELKTYMETDMETWSEVLIARGRSEGKTEGVREAIVLVLNARFGSTPPAILEKLESIDDLDRLHEILDQALHAHSLDELGLTLAGLASLLR